MKTIKKIFHYIADSRGFSLPRCILTGLYAFLVVFSAPLFATSVGNYPVQLSSLVGTLGGAWLLWRSLKKMFDRKVRDKISAVVHKIWAKTGELFAKLGKKISHALGLDKKRARGKDEKDFIFREKRGRKHGSHKLRNPMRWTELEDNAQRVRYIFIEFMLRNLKSGYRLKPSSTPDDISRDLAGDDAEKLLFSSYRLARYSGGRETIDDETVQALEELRDKKKK